MEEIFSHPLVWPYAFSSTLKPLRNKHGPCAGCGKFPDPGQKFRTCAACKSVLYCSKECQKSDRNVHRYVVIHLQNPVTAGKDLTWLNYTIPAS